MSVLLQVLPGLTAFCTVPAEGRRGMGRDALEEGGGGQGVWNPTTFVDQQWPKSTFPFVDFFFFHHEIWVQRRGWGGSSYGCRPF